MKTTITLEEARKVIGFSELPDEHILWIIERSEAIEFDDGVNIVKTGDPAEEMIIILEGKVLFYMDISGRLVYYMSFENNHESGGLGGLLPYSRMKSSPGYSYTSGKTRFLRLNKKHFGELEQLNPDFIQRCVGYMTERARTFATLKMQQEKMSALGQLSAGIAHELNNPAAAINRISSELKKRLTLNDELTEKLLTHRVDPGFILSVKGMVDEKIKAVKNLPAMKRIELEDELNEWMENEKITNLSADTFVDSGFTKADLEGIRKQSNEKSFGSMLQWLENAVVSRRILNDLADASCRISDLVTAIKSHVHMDRTNDMQFTKIQKDIDNTLTLLGYKMRDKNITIERDYGQDLPEIPAYVGELNQVWTNIIDNAIFAMEQGGLIKIGISKDDKNMSVTITDNGPGIPKEIVSRIFDPFFTTKKVGQGTGIGLDLANRIIQKHNGEIKVYSEPGRTEFKICIPLKQEKLA